ncbi:Leucoanthocyanidin reductase [Senna tora]|uniref:Leucoanthocyanidin reductase n=1 Tax=Senna tora TaxID=362788 RepID=A0A834TUR4_9FABA|nr:Leucoanthocyanidin reductase [Senna tora]
MTPLPNTPAPANKTRVLMAGGTGFIGEFVARASVDAGFDTFLLIRPCPTTTYKQALIKEFQEKGATLIHGVINDKELMEKILKEHEIEIVISLVGGRDLLDQLILVEAMKSIKTIKRYIPSEFGHDVDRATPVEPGLRMYKQKRTVRRAVEECGIPYTYICSNSIASWPYYDNSHPAQLPPPLDHMHIYGDGSVKAYFVDGNDIGRLAIKAASDIRTLNKIVHFRPQSNYYSMNELASLWENKIGRTIPRVTISEDLLLALAAENIEPDSVVASLTHDIFIKGCHNYNSDDPKEVDIGTLFPEETFRSLEDCFEDFAQLVREKKTNDYDDGDHINGNLKGTKNDDGVKGTKNGHNENNLKGIMKGDGVTHNKI